MAKKISKHSRAARRGEIAQRDLEPEAQSLVDVPRSENTNVANSIIRNTINKNEDLLSAKLNKRNYENQASVSKKTRKTQSNHAFMKLKQTKFMKLEGRLSTKIEQSIERSRHVQVTRKSGWDTINKSIKTENLYLANLFREEGDIIDDDSEDEGAAKKEEDKYVAEFFGTGAAAGEEEEEAVVRHTPKNVFAMLEETEC